MNRSGKQPGDRQANGSSDRRWVIVAEDGRYVILGRATDPSEVEICQAEDSLRAQGLAGWLVIMSGSAYGPTLPSLIEVRPLASPAKPWTEAAAACLAAIAARRTDPGS